MELTQLKNLPTEGVTSYRKAFFRDITNFIPMHVALSRREGCWNLVHNLVLKRVSLCYASGIAHHIYPWPGWNGPLDNLPLLLSHLLINNSSSWASWILTLYCRHRHFRNWKGIPLSKLINWPSVLYYSPVRIYSLLAHHCSSDRFETRWLM